MIDNWLLAARGRWRRWIFTWVQFGNPESARRALACPGPIDPSFAVACLYALMQCRAGQGPVWAPIATEAASRCRFGRARGRKAFGDFISWIDASTGRVALAQFETGSGEPRSRLWKAAIDLCHALLAGGAQPDPAMAEQPGGPAWMLSELCAVIGLHRSSPEALVRSILSPRRRHDAEGALIDCRRCSMALTALPNDWIEAWLTPEAARGSEAFLAHMLASKVLGSGELDEAGARLLLMLGGSQNPFSSAMHWPMGSTNLWRWRACEVSWAGLLENAGSFGGWPWACDLLALLGGRRAGLPPALEATIASADWEGGARGWMARLGPPPAFVFDRLRGQAGEALLLRLELEGSVEAGLAAGLAPSARRRALAL